VWKCELHLYRSEEGPEAGFPWKEGGKKFKSAW